MYPLVLLLSYICQPQHQEVSHLIDRSGALELITQKKSLDLAFEPIADLLVDLLSLFCTDIVIYINFLFLQLYLWHLARIVHELLLLWHVYLL